MEVGAKILPGRQFAQEFRGHHHGLQGRNLTRKGKAWAARRRTRAARLTGGA